MGRLGWPGTFLSHAGRVQGQRLAASASSLTTTTESSSNAAAAVIENIVFPVDLTKGIRVVTAKPDVTPSNDSNNDGDASAAVGDIDDGWMVVDEVGVGDDDIGDAEDDVNDFVASN